MNLNLKSLYSDMIDLKETRCKFPFSFRSKGFSCVFIIDTKPWLLYIFALGNIGLAIEVRVNSDFSISTNIDNEKYKLLCLYLNLKYDPENKFKPSVFFEELNNNIPLKLKIVPGYSEILTIARNTQPIDEADKIYFVTVRNNPKGAM